MKFRALLAIAFVALSPVTLRADENAPEAPPKIVQATAADDLKAMAGQTATVEGKVMRVGSTSGGGITFLDMAPGMNAFVAVIFKSNAAAFPDGFDKYKDQTVRVTGKIEMFKDTKPEIVVKTPDQIVIVPAPKPEDAPLTPEKQ